MKNIDFYGGPSQSGGEWSGEFLNKAKDGSLFWERALITSIKDEAGRIAHFLAVKEDITERKKAEEALQQMRSQLTHVARLSTLGEMVAELAHELNHPLYAILNYAKACRNVLAEEGPPDLDSLREWNEEIADIALSAGEVVKRLRSFARRAESPRTACRIEEIVKEALGLVAVETRRARVTVETSLLRGFAADSSGPGADSAGPRQSSQQRDGSHADLRPQTCGGLRFRHRCATQRSRLSFPIAASACRPGAKRRFSSPT